MNAAPKQAEKVARGSLIPSSVPATYTGKIIITTWLVDFYGIVKYSL